MPYMKRYEKTLYNKDWVYQSYVVENRNAAQVADLIGCDNSAVLDALRKFGIPLKTISESQSLAPHPGSNAPRPRSKFYETIHNKEWVLARLKEGLSYSAIGRLAGCSPGCVSKAIDKLGVLDDLELLNSYRIKRKKDIREYASNKQFSSIGCSRRLARVMCLKGPCVICGGPGDEVNHKDRDPFNNDRDNLERLCVSCHRKQHALEEKVAFDILKDMGFSVIDIYNRARESILLDADKKEQEL